MKILSLDWKKGHEFPDLKVINELGLKKLVMGKKYAVARLPY